MSVQCLDPLLEVLAVLARNQQVTLDVDFVELDLEAKLAALFFLLGLAQRVNDEVVQQFEVLGLHRVLFEVNEAAVGQQHVSLLPSLECALRPLLDHSGL